VDPAVERANQLLVACGEREIVRCIPHTSLAHLRVDPRRGQPPAAPRDVPHRAQHEPTVIMRVYQQVMEMGDAGVQTLEKVIGCTLGEAFTLLSGRGVLATNRQPAKKTPPSPMRRGGWKAPKPLGSGHFKRLMGLEPTTFCMASRP
jgi:hypothetical protein